MGGHSIGVTGNIACGKSMVVRRLEQRGAVCIDADVVAHTLMRPGQPAWQAVVKAFGRTILQPDGVIDRDVLRAIVFADREQLRRRNAAVHPFVHRELVERVRTAPEGQVLVIEAVALVEAGTAALLDSLWLVLSRPELQVRRLRETRGLTDEEAWFRVRGQPPAEEKVALADIVIHNDGTLEELVEQVDRAWEVTRERWGCPKGDGGTGGWDASSGDTPAAQRGG